MTRFWCSTSEATLSSSPSSPPPMSARFRWWTSCWQTRRLPRPRPRPRPQPQMRSCNSSMSASSHCMLQCSAPSGPPLHLHDRRWSKPVLYIAAVDMAAWWDQPGRSLQPRSLARARRCTPRRTSARSRSFCCGVCWLCACNVAFHPSHSGRGGRAGCSIRSNLRLPAFGMGLPASPDAARRQRSSWAEG